MLLFNQNAEQVYEWNIFGISRRIVAQMLRLHVKEIVFYFLENYVRLKLIVSIYCYTALH